LYQEFSPKQPMTESFLDLLIVFALSSTKYLIGASSALVKDFNFLLSMVTTVGGGMTGVIVYLYCWDGILWVKHKLFTAKPHAKVKFNKFRRWLVGFIKNYGLFGIAFLTPVLLSVPVGTILAASIEPNKWKIKRFMLISFVNWSLLFFGIFQLLDINPKDTINRLLRRGQTSHKSSIWLVPAENHQAFRNQKILFFHHQDVGSPKIWHAGRGVA